MTPLPRPSSRTSACLAAFLSVGIIAACTNGSSDPAGNGTSSGAGSPSTTGSSSAPSVSGGASATGGVSTKSGTGVASKAAGSGAKDGTSSAASAAAGASAVASTGGANTAGGASAKADSGGASTVGGARGGASAKGGAAGSSAATTLGGASASGGATGAWPNIRVVGNHLHDRWGTPFAVRSIESMFGNGSSNPTAFVAGHKALGANTLGPLPNTSVSSPTNIAALLAAAYEAGLVIGVNADHTSQGTAFFRSAQIQAIINRYPNVFLQEAVELGSEMTASEWIAAAKAKVDTYVALYPDKPLKIGSPMGGRSPRFALDRCEEVVDYYYSKGGRGGLIFTCQLYWRAATASWSYQEENGFVDGLPGILAAIDAMTASPCMFMPGLDHQDDVGYTGWREVMDHVRASHTEPGLRLSFQWWVYYNEGDPYANDLTTDPNDALAGITAIGEEVKERLGLDREYVELGPLND